MPTFEYRAVSAQGRSTRGVIEAQDVREARRKLRQEQVTPLEIHARDSGGGMSPALNRGRSQRKIKRVDLDKMQITRAKADKLSLAFLQKLLQLVESGLPLGDAIKSLNQRLTEPAIKAVCEELWKDLSEGSTLANAMRRRPKLFDPTLASMIEAGEATGNLKPILQNIVALLENRIALRNEVMAGLAYPAFILVIVFFVLTFVLFYLMPRVREMLDSMGGELSLAAKLVMGLAEASFTFGPFIAGGAVILGAILFQWRRTTEGRLSTDRMLLRIPVVNQIIQNAEVSRLANLAAILLGSGVDTTDSLRLLEKSFKNTDLQNRFHTARGLVNDGSSFAAALARQAILDEMDSDILSISENTGSLVKGFENIYRNRYNALGEQMKRLTVVLSTGALFFVFGIVFLLVFGVVSSIMQLSSTVLGG